MKAEKRSTTTTDGEPIHPEARRKPGEIITPFEDRVRWTPEEKDKLIAAGIAIVRADPTGRISPKQALMRAQIQVLAPDRHRGGSNLAGHRIAWFTGPVLAGLSPNPASPALPVVDEPTTTALVAVPARDEAAEMAGSPPDPNREALAILGGLNSEALLALALSRMADERRRDLRADAALLGEVRQLAAGLRSLESRLAERLQPLEANTAVGHRLLRTVMEHLDPGLLRTFEASEQDLGPLSPPLPPPAEPEPPTPAKAVPTPRAALTPPPCRVCVVGIRPAAEAQVRVTVGGRAAISCILDESKALRHEYRQYDAVVITRHAAHALTTKVHSILSDDRIVRLRSTSADGVAQAINNLAYRYEQDWKLRHAHIN